MARRTCKQCVACRNELFQSELCIDCWERRTARFLSVVYAAVGIIFAAACFARC